MSIQITITDPTRDEALRLADYLYDLAGYGKKDGIVAHQFTATPAQVADQLKSQIEAISRTPVTEFIDSNGATCTVSEIAASSFAPAIQPPPPAAGVSLPLAHLPVDSAGHTWDERIHASSKAVVSDGTWRLRRNLDPKVLEAVLAERATNTPEPGRVMSEAESNTSIATVLATPTIGATLNDVGLPPPAPGAWPFPSEVPPPPPVSDVPPPPPASDTLALTTPPPPPTVTGTLTFAAFMQRVTAAIGAGTIAQTDVAAALTAESVASIPLLASIHADKIDAVAARLGV
jgi:hypothetical protein